jgi:hypothetical protein
MLRYFRNVALGVLLGLLFGCALGKVHAHDYGQNSDPDIKAWFESLKQPDNPVASCCGVADGYWCDDIHVKGGRSFCTITDDRIIPQRTVIPVGTEIQIPDEKMLDGKVAKGNPSGHSIVFLNSGGTYVYCFIMASGT